MEATMKMNDRYAWPDATTREANSVDLARRLRREIGGYEREFGVPSASLAEALATGRVAEDGDPVGDRGQQFLQHFDQLGYRCHLKALRGSCWDYDHNIMPRKAFFVILLA